MVLVVFYGVSQLFHPMDSFSSTYNYRCTTLSIQDALSTCPSPSVYARRLVQGCFSSEEEVPLILDRILCVCLYCGDAFLTMLTQCEQDLYLGTLPRMDLPPFDWIFHFLYCEPAVGRLYSNLRWLKRK